MRRYWRILGAQRHPLRFLASRALMKLGLSSHLLIRRRGYCLRFYPTSISASLWINPMDRQSDEDFLLKYLKPGDTVIDVGANIGTVSLTAAGAVGSSGSIYSIEAHPKTCEFLRGNLSLNGRVNVCVYNVALGDHEGFVHITDTRSDDQNSVAQSESGLRMPLRTLDGLGIDAPRINLLKIDVEGYEWFVLAGARETLSRTEAVYFESCEHHFRQYGYGTGSVIGLLEAAGFGVFRMDRGRRISAVTGDYSSNRRENLVALRSLEDFLARTSIELAVG